MEVDNVRSCDFCGALLGEVMHFQGSADVTICLTCVKSFNAVFNQYEKAKTAMRRNITFNIPIPTHNFKIIEGGKLES
jgi:hypothetical protein